MTVTHLTGTSHAQASSFQRGGSRNVSFVIPLWLGAALIICLGSGSAHAVEIKFSVGANTVRITDNGPRDMARSVDDVIRFNSNAAAPDGFTLPRGSSVTSVDGKVSLSGDTGAFVEIFTEDITLAVVLNEFQALRQTRVAATNQTLKISFQHKFDEPDTQEVEARDSIVGVLGGARAVAQNDTVKWQGFINDTAITTPAAATEVHAPTASLPTMGVNGSHGFSKIEGSKPWILKGDLEIKLGEFRHQLSLP